jgi:benzoate/toluate 1,2-dioxygenase beta subunit
MISNIEILSDQSAEIKLRYNFLTLNHRYQITDQFFGTVFLTLRRTGTGFLITAKKVVLKNDYIRQVIDIYHI